MGINSEAYQAAQQLRDKFPSLHFIVIRSSRYPRSFVVGVRPKTNVGGKLIWEWTPQDGFPNEELLFKLNLIA